MDKIYGRKKGIRYKYEGDIEKEKKNVVFSF
jgi:hypothetical protein